MTFKNQNKNTIAANLNLAPSKTKGDAYQKVTEAHVTSRNGPAKKINKQSLKELLRLI